jgi:hypothetical protein
MRLPARFFSHPDGVIRSVRVSGSSFSPENGLNPSGETRPPRSSGVRSGSSNERKKRIRAHSVGERTCEPHHFLVANPHPPLVALSPLAPPLSNPSAGCLYSAVPPPTSLYSVDLLLSSYIPSSGYSSRLVKLDQILAKFCQIHRTVSLFMKIKPNTPIVGCLAGGMAESLALPTPNFRPIRRHLTLDLAVGNANGWRCSYKLWDVGLNIFPSTTIYGPCRLCGTNKQGIDHLCI